MIEMVLYIAVVTVVISALGFFTAESYNIRARNQIITEVEQQGILVAKNISSAIREAETVVEPLVGTSSGTLWITSIEPLKNPTFFSLSDQAIFVSEGGASPIALTNSRVIVSDLNFKNLALPDTSDSIEFVFTLTYQNPNNYAVYDYSQTFYGAANRP